MVLGHVDVAGNRDRVFWRRGACRRNKELGTADIELWIRRSLVRLMQGQQLRTKQIIPARDVTWEFDRQVSVVRQDFLGAPFPSAGVIVFREDLEPTRPYSVVVGKGGVDLLHVDGAWAFVGDVDGAGLGAVGPAAVFEGYG